MMAKILLIAALIFFTSFKAQADDEAQSQIVLKLNETLGLLRAWSQTNNQKISQFEEYLKKQKEQANQNFEYTDKKDWQKVKSLNQNYLMLLEASYAFAKSTESEAQNQENRLRSRAWQDCIKSNKCNFKILNERLDHEALELYAFTRESALDTQKNLLKSIDTLEEFNLDLEGSHGLNDSVDNLSKVSSTQAQALVSLSSQISNLTKLTAHLSQKEHEKKELEAKEQSLYFSQNKVKSPHLSLSLKDYD